MGLNALNKEATDRDFMEGEKQLGLQLSTSEVRH